jgi:aerobic carbon-monoxide dehydrogenase medium subunit
VKPARFAYRRPDSLEEALGDLAEHADDATLLAGGQSLVPMMNLRLVQPPVLIDLNGLDELDALTVAQDRLVLGAMTRHRTLEHSPEVARAAPMLRDAMAHVAYPSVRNRGTVGGSVAHADPAAELPCVLLAGDATFVLARASGRREVAADDFFVGPYMTAREPDELLVEIHVPVAGASTASGFAEFARKSGDFALALAAASITMQDGRCTRTRIALGSVDAVPVRATEAERVLEGQPLETAAIEAAAQAASAGVQPRGDSHGSSEYRRRLADVVVRRALEAAAARHAANADGGPVHA